MEVAATDRHELLTDIQELLTSTTPSVAPNHPNSDFVV
jgi:hypothetical protein